MHNTSKVQMGCPQSSDRTVVSHLGVVAAGVVVRRKSDGTLSVTSTDGDFYGVSLGRDLSNAGYSSICTAGLGIPVQLTAGLDPTVGAVVTVSNSTGLAASSGTATAATYATGRIGGTGVNGGQQEDGTTVGAALIDMVGGL